MENIILDGQYWSNRYLSNETGWDIGNSATPLANYIDKLTDKNIKILIPGAGNSYEFQYLIEASFTNVYVLDYAATPIKNLKKKLPSVDDKFFLEMDFFQLNETFDLIIEQTFFCALNVEMRQQYADKMHAILHSNGKLAGLLFQFPLTETGPPFGGSSEEYRNLFAEKFDIKTLETAHNSIQPRKGNELFFIFTKK